MTPLGSIFSTIIQSLQQTNISQYFDYALAVVIGIFLHVSTSILFETSEEHQYNLKKFGVVLAGLATAFLITVF